MPYRTASLDTSLVDAWNEQRKDILSLTLSSHILPMLEAEVKREMARKAQEAVVAAAANALREVVITGVCACPDFPSLAPLFQPPPFLHPGRVRLAYWKLFSSFPVRFPSLPPSLRHLHASIQEYQLHSHPAVRGFSASVGQEAGKEVGILKEGVLGKGGRGAKRMGWRLHEIDIV